MNSAENKIAELKKRISELEEKLENVMIYSEGANVSFHNRYAANFRWRSKCCA